MKYSGHRSPTPYDHNPVGPCDYKTVLLVPSDHTKCLETQREPENNVACVFRILPTHTHILQSWKKKMIGPPTQTHGRSHQKQWVRQHWLLRVEERQTWNAWEHVFVSSTPQWLMEEIKGFWLFSRKPMVDSSDSSFWVLILVFVEANGPFAVPDIGVSNKPKRCHVFHDHIWSTAPRSWSSHVTGPQMSTFFWPPMCSKTAAKLQHVLDRNKW